MKKSSLSLIVLLALTTSQSLSAGIQVRPSVKKAPADTKLSQVGTHFQCEGVLGAHPLRIERFQVFIPENPSVREVQVAAIAPFYGHKTKPEIFRARILSDDHYAHYVLGGEIVHSEQQETYVLDFILHQIDKNQGIAMINHSWDWWTSLAQPEMFRCQVKRK